jgi:hypothetical protein
MVGPSSPADADSIRALQRDAAAAERSCCRALKQLLALRKLEGEAAEDPAGRNEANSRLSPDASPGTTENKSPSCQATSNPVTRDEPNSVPPGRLPSSVDQALANRVQDQLRKVV